jgi:hypothetical protein
MRECTLLPLSPCISICFFFPRSLRQENPLSPFFSQRRIHSKEISLIEESKGNLKEIKKFPLWGLLGEIISDSGPHFFNTYLQYVITHSPNDMCLPILHLWIKGGKRKKNGYLLLILLPPHIPYSPEGLLETLVSLSRKSLSHISTRLSLSSYLLPLSYLSRFVELKSNFLLFSYFTNAYTNLSIENLRP